MQQKFTQLFVRIAVATAFLSAVADRIGLWGKYSLWGNWGSFLEYSNKLNFFAPEFLKEPLAIIATILEVVFAGLLIIGYKTKITANLSGILLLIFAFTMTFALGLISTFAYSVWVSAGACFLLAEIDNYDYSLDKYLKK